MEQRTIYEYYAFGYNYGVLKEGVGASTTKERAQAFISTLLSKLSELKLPVTSIVADPLKDISKELEELKEKSLGTSLLKRIREALDKIDAAMDAELQLKKVYVLTEKRYELEKLLDHPAGLLGSGVFDNLSRHGAKDFEIACRQVALAQATSTAFHLMRALEAEVKSLYFAYKKTNRLDKPMWGPMIQQLRAKKKPKPSIKLLDHLDGMRSHFRNPTQHPEAFYTMDEAQDLLNQTITAMNMIGSEMPYRKNKLV